jgi:hypothetical protein
MVRGIVAVFFLFARFFVHYNPADRMSYSCLFAVLICLAAALSSPQGGDVSATTRDSHFLRPLIGQEDQKTALLLNKLLPSVNVQRIAVSDAIDFLTDVTGINMIADWNSLKAAGVDAKSPFTFSRENVSTDAVLREIVRQCGIDKMDYGVIDGVVVVSTRARLDQIRKTFPFVPGNSNAQLNARLEKSLPSFQAQHIALEHIFNFLQDVSGAPIHVNWDALRPTGVSPQTPVSLTLRNIKMSSVLELALLQSGSDDVAFKPEGDVIRISTREDLSTAVAPPTVEPPATAPGL